RSDRHDYGDSRRGRVGSARARGNNISTLRSGRVAVSQGDAKDNHTTDSNNRGGDARDVSSPGTSRTILSTVASRHRLQHVSPGSIPFVTGEARLSSSPEASQHSEGEGATERDRDNTEGQGARAYAPKSVRMLNYNIE
ncbi:hypothetical protein BaRGS_00036791, partial [Batillaria attramentaria]